MKALLIVALLVAAACDGSTTTVNECRPEAACLPGQTLAEVDGRLVCLAPTYCPPPLILTADGKCRHPGHDRD